MCSSIVRSRVGARVCVQNIRGDERAAEPTWLLGGRRQVMQVLAEPNHMRCLF